MRWSTAHDVLVELKWIVAAGSRADIPKPIAALWKRREAVSWAVTAVISLAFLILAFTYVRQRKLEPRPWRFSLDAPDKVTLANYQTAGPAQISPDGATLAFVGVDDSGKRQLYIRALDALSVEPLAGTTNVTYPFWSPNSRYLAFFADGKLKRIAADGGLAQVICHAPNGRGGSWGRDLDGRPGTIVFAPDHAGVLLRVSSDGGQAVAVTSLDGTRFELSHRQPEFLSRWTSLCLCCDQQPSRE
jgi:Tol biopolymer transport system component